jgi:hypothetical protein
MSSIKGPINENEKFYIATIDTNTIKQVVVYDDEIYYFSSDTDTIQSNGVLFKAEFVNKNINPNLIYLYDTTNNKNVAVNFYSDFLKTVLVYTNSSQITSLTNTSNIYWPSPTIFLTDLTYKLTYCDTQDTCSKETSPYNLTFIPSDLYYKNTSNKCVNPSVTPPLNSANIWIDGQMPPDRTEDFFWSNLTDCKINVDYEYCSSTEVCNDDGCKGACVLIAPDNNYLWTQCNYKLLKRQFVCGNSNNNNILIISVVIGSVLLLIIILVIVFFTLKRKKRKKKAKETEQNNTSQSTNPTTSYSSTYPKNYSLTYPNYYSTTNYPTKSYSNKLSNYPSNYPSTNLSTNPSTNPSTNLSTNPSTNPST